MICPYCQTEIPDEAIRCPHCTTIIHRIEENIFSIIIRKILTYATIFIILQFAVDTWKYADPIFIFLTKLGINSFFGIIITLVLLYFVWPFILIMIFIMVWTLFKMILESLYTKIKTKLRKNKK